MLMNKYRPVYAPDNEGGVDQEVDTTTVDVGAGGEAPDSGAGEGAGEQPDGPGSGRSAIRKSLEKGFSDANKAAEKPVKPAKKTRSGRDFDQVRERQGAKDGAEAPVEGAEGEVEGEPEAPAVAIPEGFTATPEQWAKTPPEIQAAITKRLGETANGVKQIQAKYADIDQAIAPHLEAIRRQGHTPAQAVNQLFSWFQAIAGNPGVAFPALAKSFNYDWNKLKSLPAYGEQAPQPGQPQVGADGKPVEAQVGADGKPVAGQELPPAWANYISGLEQKLGSLQQGIDQRFGTIEQSFQQQAEQRTQSSLNQWSQGKAHFEEVRQLMAHFIQSGAVPLKDGEVDLDGAYNMAIFAHPEVRVKVLGEQKAAEAAAAKKASEDAVKARQAAADKARKAGVSVQGGAPGGPGTAQVQKKGQRTSVRDSLKAAIEEVRGN